MLLTNFYSYKTLENSSNALKVQIEINPNHSIFNGHFEGFPVVPGVCQVLMIKEVLSDFYNKEFRLLSSKAIKFLAMINPNETANLVLSIDFTEKEGLLKVNAILSAEGKNYMKFKGVYCE